MIVLSEFLNNSSLNKAILSISNSKKVSVGSLGICQYQGLRDQITETCLVCEVYPDNSLMIYPVVRLDEKNAEVALVPQYLIQNGLIWSDPEGYYQFILTTDPVKRIVIENGIYLEGDEDLMKSR